MEDFRFQGFKVLELRCSNQLNSSCHCILMKSHEVRDYDPQKPSGKTLFMINIPPYITEDNLKAIMSKYGKVTRVFIHKDPTSKASPVINYPIFDPAHKITSFKVAYIVFSSKAPINVLMDQPSSQPLELNQTDLNSGLSKWYEEYNQTMKSADEIVSEAKKIIEDHDLRKLREKELASNDPDEDGWVTVNATAKRKKVVVSKMAVAKTSVQKKKKRKTQLLNFYEFQKKSAKMEHLEQHRKMFEEDRKRLNKMKENRKFKPL